MDISISGSLSEAEKSINFAAEMQQGTHKQGDSGYLEVEPVAQVTGQFTQVEVLDQTDVTVIARGIRHGRWYLLKALRSEVAGQQMYRQMLLKEFNILMQLNHPNVVQGIGMSDVEPLGLCIVMEWIEGHTLDWWLDLSPSRNERRRALDQLLDGVAHIHSRGVAHRDLKPQNIMISDNGGWVKVIDFGLADTDAHATLKQPAGTLGYTSPEQLSSNYADVRNDIYSLGIIMRQLRLGPGINMLAGRCLRPIEQRVQSIEQLQQSINKLSRLKRWLGRIAVLAAVAGVAVGITALTVRKTESVVVRQITANTDSLQQVIAQMDSQVVQQKATVEQVKSVNQALRQEQDRVAQRERQVAATVERGKRAIDQAMRATHLMEYLDTLSPPNQVRSSYGDEMLAGGQALDQFMAGLQGYNGQEMSSIHKQLEDHYLNVWIVPINQKLKRASRW